VPLRPYQQKTVEQLLHLVHGPSRIPHCVFGPTGSGKSHIIREFIAHAHVPTVVYTNRKLLFDQIRDHLATAGVVVGLRAAGHDKRLLEDIQVAMVQSETKRVAIGQHRMHSAKLVIVDEIHDNCQGGILALMQQHIQQGALVVGFTATPLDINHIIKKIIVSVTYDECYQNGWLLPCHIYEVQRPDNKWIKKVPVGEVLIEGKYRVQFRQQIVGRVLDAYRRLNPLQVPTLLFAPDRPSATWFAQQFCDEGIKAAAIDGQKCWVDDRDFHGTKKREEIIQRLKDRDIKVVCNRFVLTTGVDIPEVGHGICATPYGSVKVFRQAFGRILRPHQTLRNSVSWADHGGNCLDEITEVLTSNGWKSRVAIDQSDLVAAFNPEDYSVTWQPINEIINRTLRDGEEMFEAVGRQCDIRVTSGHRMVFKKRKNAGRFVYYPCSFQIETAKYLFDGGRRFKLPVSGYQKAPGVPLRDCEIEFLGWWITDGNLYRNEIVIGQANHQPHFKRLVKCLDECGFSYRQAVVPALARTIHGRPAMFRETTRFAIPKGNSLSRPRSGWEHLEPYLDKNLSPLLENLDHRQFEIFLHGCHLGDGDKKKGTGGSYRIAKGCKAFIERLQSLSVRRGFKANLKVEEFIDRKPMYCLNIQKKTDQNILGPSASVGQCYWRRSTTTPGERVWCVSNPIGTIFIRRNGKVAVVGNCFRLGDPRVDIDWTQTPTDLVIQDTIKERMKSKPESEPIICPNCHEMRFPGESQEYNMVCPACGFAAKGRVHHVLQVDGTLLRKTGYYYPKRRVASEDLRDKWRKCFYRCKNSGRTIAQARALFKYENFCEPDPNWPLMPKRMIDLRRKIKDIPKEHLVEDTK
jgi:superfamily II DNA or RNA helicase